MEKKNITIAEYALLEAYKNGNADQKELLERLYGKEMFRPKNIMDRIKTFEDAITILGGGHPLVTEYRKLDIANVNHLAYMKLCIIAIALNEGWKPQFTKDEKRYYPYFWFYTKEEYDATDEDDRADLILFGAHAKAGAYAGLAYAYSLGVPADEGTGIGSRLCFKTEELAEYAGKQFIDIYYDFYMK